MQPEQQRIMGYFIEEAKEHLNTIEQSLLNLQSVIEEPEMLNEVFRAAHSVKGGAAMLGIYSIQQTAHYLEDYFKVLQEHPIKVDQKLESLFFRGFDTLQGLVEQLQSSLGITEEVAAKATHEAELVYTELKAHLAMLVGQTGGVLTVEPEISSVPLDTLQAPQKESPLLQIFQNDVPVHLREMLQLFKQTDHSMSRQQLQKTCQNLAQVAEQFELSNWNELAELAYLAIANPENSYPVLAPLLIKEIKVARDLVLAGRSAEIAPSPQLQALVPQESTPTPVERQATPFEEIPDSRGGVNEPLPQDVAPPDLLQNSALDPALYPVEPSSVTAQASAPLNFLTTESEMAGVENNLADPAQADLESLWQEMADDSQDGVTPISGADVATSSDELFQLFEADSVVAADSFTEMDFGDLFDGESDKIPGVANPLEEYLLEANTPTSSVGGADLRDSSPRHQDSGDESELLVDQSETTEDEPFGANDTVEDEDFLTFSSGELETEPSRIQELKLLAESGQQPDTELADTELGTLSEAEGFLAELVDQRVEDAATNNLTTDFNQTDFNQTDFSQIDPPEIPLAAPVPAESLQPKLPEVVELTTLDELTPSESEVAEPDFPETTVDLESFGQSGNAASTDSSWQLATLNREVSQGSAVEKLSWEQALSAVPVESVDVPDFTKLDTLLEESLTEATASAIPSTEVSGELEPSASLNDFSELEALLEEKSVEVQSLAPPTTPKTSELEFEGLEKLLEDSETVPESLSTKRPEEGRQVKPQASRRASGSLGEQNMRVPIKHLDNLSNIVGELVVDRNSLEQNQERLRQSLDNLLYQVQQLSDAGQQMEDLYERSLLESSLLAISHGSQSSLYSNVANRPGAVSDQTSHSTGNKFDALEMDRFTEFHTLSQEILERIVRLREATSDIEFTAGETDEVTRMFRQATTQLQEGLTRSRMMPFSQIAERLPRAVRDLALRCGKNANLEIEGRETLIDKGLLERLYDPMTHLVNNTLAHGIELPEVRQALGKPPVGQITIRAFYQGNQTIISVSDDGAGIDSERVKAKAVEKGLISPSEAEGMSQLEIYNLLFHSGFSTKDQADDLAGRGVGMDVVRTSLDEIRGVISTDSTLGVGTTFTIRLPLTLSITKALCCIDTHCRVAFPLDGVEDILDVSKEQIQSVAEGQFVIPWRQSLVSFRPLSELLSHNSQLTRGNLYGDKDESIISVVVLRGAGSFLAVQVDQLLGEQEIVIKQLEGPVPKPTGVAGVTVLGDGRIMPIADVLELIDLATGKLEVGDILWNDGAAKEKPAQKNQPIVLIVDDSITVRELLSVTFNKVGYRVEQARDGQEAWEKLRSGLPCDLVFCDIEMPRMDGLELLSQVQKDPNLNDLPMAMLTSRGAERHRQMAIQLGAKGYFTKPYLEEALLDAAQRLLNGEILVN